MDLEAAADVTLLPRLTEGGPAFEGRIRERPEDFRVVEVPAYLPSGEGDHLFVRFEKTGLDTPEAVKRLAAALEVDPRQAGWAGLKDRHAITEQWASFLFGDPAKLEGLELEGIRVLEAKRHGNKLRTGHLAGNRFALRVAGVDPEALPVVEARMERLAREGVPHYFGAQRFGRGGQNLTLAGRWLLEGGRAPRKPFHRKLQVSALQSAMFNALLAARLRDGLFAAAVDGDLMQKEETGGMFVSHDEADDARVKAFEISPTGPMFGAKMRWPETDARAREEATLAAFGLDPEALGRFKKVGPGTRRPYRVRPTEPVVRAAEDGLHLAFGLPSGAYATVVLRELLHTDPT